MNRYSVKLLIELNKNMGKKNKSVAVLFSGGLDSTYLVWKNLKDGNTVFPIYIEISNNKVKTVMEKNRIELLCKKFSEEFNADKPYDESPMKDIQYALTVNVTANEDSLHFKQVPIWILGILFLQGLEVDEIQIGYVGNDDAISYLKDIQKIYKSYQSMSEPLKPLVFPLFKERKYDIAKELPYQYRELLFSCENATIIGSEDAALIEYEPCCDCTPCRTIISSDYYHQEFPEIYKKKLREKRIRELRNDGYKIIDEKGNEVDGWDNVKCAPEPQQLAIDFDEPIEHDKMESVDLMDKVEYDKEPEVLELD